MNLLAKLRRRPPSPPPPEPVAAAHRAPTDGVTRARARQAMLALWPQRPGSRPLPPAPASDDAPTGER
jgi:hypothetical protein